MRCLFCVLCTYDRIYFISLAHTAVNIMAMEIDTVSPSMSFDVQTRAMTFDGCDVKIVYVCDKANNEINPWFKVADLLRALGFPENSFGTAKRRLKTGQLYSYDELRTRFNLYGCGGVNSQLPDILTLTPNDRIALYTNEAGVYKFVIRSTKPSAEAFQDFICERVLPDIRKYGRFIGTGETPSSGGISWSAARDTGKDAYKSLMDAIKTEVIDQSTHPLVSRGLRMIYTGVGDITNRILFEGASTPTIKSAHGLKQRESVASRLNASGQMWRAVTERELIDYVVDNAAVLRTRSPHELLDMIRNKADDLQRAVETFRGLKPQVLSQDKVKELQQAIGDTSNMSEYDATLRTAMVAIAPEVVKAIDERVAANREKSSHRAATIAKTNIKTMTINQYFGTAAAPAPATPAP